MTQPEQSLPTIPVVAAVARRGETFLICQRPMGKRHGGLWEFPGGKCALDEFPEAALARELEEELGVRTLLVRPAVFEARDPGSPFVIAFHPVEIEGEPQAREHTAVAWVPRSDLQVLPLAPSDDRFVRTVLTATRP